MTKSPLMDLTGQKFHHWTVIGRAPNGNRGQTMWLCECECGKVKPVNGQHLREGRSRSCGCKSKRFTAEYNRATKTSHGWASHTNRPRLYNEYRGMKRRCYCMTDPSYEHYGGRGIKMCDEWLGEHGFENFKDWSLANNYSDELSIDRINNDGDYSPDNCRWTTMKVQQNNTRRNHRLTFNGETHTATEWGEITGIHRMTILSRIYAGWSVEDALTKPIDKTHWTKQIRLAHST